MRSISPDIFSDEQFGRWPASFRLLWIGLLLAADDQGRLVDSTKLLAGLIFQYDRGVTASTIERGLMLFTKQGKIHRYRAGTNGDGRRLIQIRRWWRHQEKATWMAKSSYPAPEKWTDRIRWHQGHDVDEINWDKVGGFWSDGGNARRKPKASKLEPGRVRAGAGKSPVRAGEDVDIEVEDDSEEENETSTVLPPTPSQPGRRAAGGKGSNLKSDEYPTIETIKRILTAASLENPKIINSVSELVATRNVADPVDEVLAALAAAFADKRVNSPPAMAAHWLQEDQRQVTFNDPKMWKSLPKEVLAAAGIDDLRTYAANRKMQAFTGGA